MTLLVEVFVRDPGGQMRILDVPDDLYQSAGFENWRTDVWGSRPVRALGARFFPQLADGDLVVEPEEVPHLLCETALLRIHLDPIAHATEHPRTVEEHRSQIHRRLRIIEDFARWALRTGGGVLIW
ncbi:hypothetical protein [Streptomyces mexicanus]|uniref:Uncharacterized protein n=1 Tax=Streptomyces mexicanus TaxID=178566 RepID=A0A7X1I353_9ACTN|nr:hypothetical protein [Streptomyces mexicanus]MBC2867591.1 hypothetical protein [Streptomyces mexicanus]